MMSFEMRKRSNHEVAVTTLSIGVIVARSERSCDQARQRDWREADAQA